MHFPRDRHFRAGAGGDDSSQLIDLRTLGQMAQARPTPAGASASNLAIPRFAASDLTRMPVPSSPVLPPFSTTDLPSHRGPDQRTPLYVLIASLTVAVMALAALVVFGPQPVRSVERRAAAPSVAVAEREPVPEREASTRDRDRGERRRGASVGAAAPAPERDDDDDAAKDAPEHRAKAPARAEPADRSVEPVERSRPRVDRAARRDAEPRAADPKPPAKKGAKAPELTADCILGVADCGSASKPPAAKPERPAPREPTENLPAKLSQSQLRKGLGVTKPMAKRCGPAHDADPGESVKVRLSITGSTGTVATAVAKGEHATTKLGGCVAAALARSRFPRFADPAMGLVFTVRL